MKKGYLDFCDRSKFCVVLFLALLVSPLYSLSAEKPPEGFEIKESTVNNQKNVGMAVTGHTLQNSVMVNGFRFQGNKTISTAELQVFLSGYLNTYCDLARLRQAADSLSEEYNRRGLNFAKAYLPAQEIKDGVVEITIVEGRLGEIEVRGNKNYSSDFIRSFLYSASSGGAVTSAKIEKGLLILNSEFTDLKVGAELKQGGEAGTVALVANVDDSFPLHLALSINNYGTKNVGRYRMSADIDWTNALLPGALFTVSGIIGERPDHLINGKVMYLVPLNSLGTKLGVSGGGGNFTVSKEFAELGMEGKDVNGSVFIRHPFIKTRSSSLSGELGFRSTDSKLYLMEQESSHDKVRTAYAGISGNNIAWRGKSFLNFNLTQGLGSFLGGTKSGDLFASRANADNGFTHLALHVGRQQYLNEYFSALLRFGGQWSSDSLLANEEWQVGGVDSVRGYAPGEAAGDKGLRASIELRVAPLVNKEILQLGTFLDYGSASRKVTVIGQVKNVDLTGAGIALYSHFNMYVPIDLRFDLGWPIGPANNTYGESPVLYFSLSSRF